MPNGNQGEQIQGQDTDGMNQQRQFIYPEAYSLSYEQVSTLFDFRRLWVDMTIWIRTLMTSIAGNQPNQAAVINRTYNTVPTNFYNTLNVFYGPQLAEQFLNYISGFILYAWRLFEAERDRDADAANAAATQWYQISIQLSEFMARLNPYWDKYQWQSLLDQYISMAIEQVVAELEGDYERSIMIYDRLINHALIIASYMARGIITRNVVFMNRQMQ